MKDIDKLKKFVFKILRDKLPEELTYHGIHHTESVLEICMAYAKRMDLKNAEKDLLSTAALFHDFGFTKTYDNHEEVSKELMKGILPDWDFTSTEIERISGMIMATKIPQNPKNELEKIIADADLDYLGTDNFYEIGERLYKELVAFNKIKNRDQWNELQIRFLEMHKYHTPFAIKYREPVKQKHLREIQKKKQQNS